MPAAPGAARRARSPTTSASRPASRDREPDVGRLLDLAGLDASYAGPRRVEAVGRRAAARDARPGARARAATSCCSTSRPRRSTRRPAARSRRRCVDLRERVGHLGRTRHPRPRRRRGGCRTGCVRLDRGRAVAAGAGARAASGVTVGIDVSLGQVAAALALVAIAIAVSFWRRAELEQDIGIAVVRSFIQLTAIGFVIQIIFDEDRIVLRGRADRRHGRLRRADRARTARARCRTRSGRCWSRSAWPRPATLGLVVALGVFEPEPRFLVPVGGMVVGNSMTAVGGGAQPARRRGARLARARDRGDAGARRDLDRGGARRSSAAACARG